MPKNLEISLLLDFYGEMLTEKQRNVVEMYYDHDLSLAEIAQHSAITRQGVRDSIKRAENQLLEYEEKLGLFRKFHAISRGLDEICEHTAFLQEEVRRHTHSEEFLERCGKIMQIAEQIGNS